MSSPALGVPDLYLAIFLNHRGNDYGRIHNITRTTLAPIVIKVVINYLLK